VAFAKAVISLHGTAWNFGEYGAKSDFASANDFCGAQTTSSLDSIAVCILDSEYHYPHIFAHYENIDRFSWR
jgi:hypothetical protein